MKMTMTIIYENDDSHNALQWVMQRQRQMHKFIKTTNDPKTVTMTVTKAMTVTVTKTKEIATDKVL